MQTRDNFLAIASHELRTPLSGLTMLLTSLVRMADSRLAQLGPEVLRDRLLKSERQARQLARLVDRLLDVSRLTSRDIQLERERTDLAEIVRDVIARFEDVIAESGSEGLAHHPGADRGRLGPQPDRSGDHQPHRATRAQVRRRRPYHDLRQLGVDRSGAPHRGGDGSRGIAPENHERIFSQYERAASDEYAGMGLGLWLVRRIVTAHGGTVTVDSVPDKGATFTVILPLNLGAAT